MVRQQRWCDIELLLEDLVDRGVLSTSSDDDVDDGRW